MATIETLLGTDKLNEMYPKVNRSFTSLNAQTASLQTQISTEQQARISAVSAHIDALVAHAAAHISAAVAGLSSTDVNGALGELLGLYTNIIASQVAGKDNEVIDGRMGADGTARASLGTLIREIHAKLLAAATASVTLGHGLNYFNTTDSSPLFVTVQGVTRVNLLGKDGNCEDTSKWGGSATLSLDSNNKVYGDHSLKVTLVTTDAGATKTKASLNLDSSKYYLFLADVKNGNATSAKITFEATGPSSAITDTTKFSTSYFKMSPSDISNSANVNLNLYVIGSAGQYAYFDGVRMFEISADTYNKIDVDPEFTGDKLADKFPYVDSVQHLRGFMLQKPGKNLLPPFTEWTLDSHATVTSAYELTLNATGNYQTSSIGIDCIPGKTYTLSYSGSGYMYTEWYDANGTYINGYYGFVSPQAVTMPNNAAKLYVRAYNQTYTGTFTFTNPQLELGSTATAFVARNDDFIYGISDASGNPLKLASNVDGSVVDTLTYDGSTATVTRRFKTDVALDGSLGWAFDTDFSGYKGVYVPLSGGVSSTQHVVKDNGAVLTNVSTYSGADQVNYNGSYLYLSIADTDSGWAEAYIPTQADIQAYFAAHPYSLTYQLATTDTETVTVEGAITTNPGGNQNSVAEGVIVGEVANPIYYGAETRYYINNTSLGNPLSNRSTNILRIYRNGVRDEKWTIQSDGKASIAAADFDETAVYTVDYVAHDKYGLTSNATSVTVSYKSSQKDILDSLNQRMADAETDISINRVIMQTSYVKGSGERSQSGSASDTVATPGTAVTTAVTFPVAYTSAPKIKLTLTGAAGGTAGYINLMAINKTTTGFTLQVNSYAAGQVDVDWEAIGK